MRLTVINIAISLFVAWSGTAASGRDNSADSQSGPSMIPFSTVSAATPGDEEGPASRGGENPQNEAVPDEADPSRYLSAETGNPSTPDEAKPGAWKLPSPDFMKRMGIEQGGWLEQGITYNSLSPGDRFNGPQGCNDRNLEYQLNQFWVYWERPTKTDGCGFDIGGRIDAVYGTDWRFGQCYGLETTFDDPNSFYGLVLPQFYLETAINNFTLKMGHFATSCSYEVVAAPPNFFYSHAYIMTGYFDPVLVTGLEGSYKLGEHWTAIGGINRGWMEFEDPSNSWNFLGGVKWRSDGERSYLSLMVDTGNQAAFTGLRDRTSVYLVYTHKITDRWQYASQYDVGQEKNGSVVTPGANANWYGTEQMMIYKLSEKWSAAVRYEWIRDEEGSRIAGVGNALLTDKGWDGLPGMAGSEEDITLGVNYRPNRNFVLRPEVRWDFYNGLPNAAGQLPFGNHTKSYQFTTAMDMVFTF
jgi:hypothetical protein